MTLAPRQGAASDSLLKSMHSNVSGLPPFANLSGQVLVDSRLEEMKSQMQMLRHEKREADDIAYREAQNAMRLSSELVSMRDQITSLHGELKK